MYSHSQISFIKSNMSITDKQTDEALSAQLREKHGPFWYTYVKDTPDDTQKAKDLHLCTFKTPIIYIIFYSII